MILLLDTSTATCRLTLIKNSEQYESEWEAGRGLAKGLLVYIESELEKRGETFSSLSAIGALKGPGSFTGLRIGLTILNTLADALGVPIVGETGESWQQKVVDRLKRGENERIIVPFYGSEAHITSPRK